jgi:hypothetical protein
MNHPRSTVPREAADVDAFVESFRAEHGFAPIAGGETLTPAPAQTAPPAAPAAPDPGITVTPPPGPAAPAVDPGTQAPAAPPAEQPPWMQGLLDRMDRMGAPEQYDPLLNDLGLAPPPVAQPQQQFVPQPQASPQAVAQPQPGTPFPGVPQDQAQQVQLIQSWIADEAQKAARQMVEPRFEAMRQVTRAQELDGLKQDYEEFRDPQRANEIASRARGWAAQMGSEALVNEPMFLEMTLLAGRQIDATRVAQAQQPPVPGQQVVPGQQQVPIETPGPAAPGAPVDPQQAIAQGIVAAGAGGLNGFWR